MTDGAAVQDFALAYGGKKRTVWFHVANALTLLVSTIALMPSHEQIKVISNYLGDLSEICKGSSGDPISGRP